MAETVFARSANYPCELHTHTNRSDGNDTPYELLVNAAGCGVKVLALTDHDTLPPATVRFPDNSEESIIVVAARLGVKLLRGIEFSCETDVEDVHIIGLGCDWTDPALIAQEADIVLSKVESYVETIRLLNDNGYPLTLEDVLTLADPPITVEQMQKKRIFDTMAAKGYTKDWSEAKLLVRNSPQFKVKRRKPSALAVIKLIHQTNGIAILAHPYLIDENVCLNGEQATRWEYIDRLIDKGLDGIECRYTYNKTTCKDKRPPEQIWEEVRRHIGSRVFLSGGSDYHADYKKSVPFPRSLGECGLTLAELESIPALKALVDALPADLTYFDVHSLRTHEATPCG